MILNRMLSKLYIFLEKSKFIDSYYCQRDF
jgi:hypothetical protein